MKITHLKKYYIEQYLSNKKQITKFQDHWRNSYQNNVWTDGVRKQNIDIGTTSQQSSVQEKPTFLVNKRTKLGNNYQQEKLVHEFLWSKLDSSIVSISMVKSHLGPRMTQTVSGNWLFEDK